MKNLKAVTLAQITAAATWTTVALAIAVGMVDESSASAGACKDKSRVCARFKSYCGHTKHVTDICPVTCGTCTPKLCPAGTTAKYVGKSTRNPKGTCVCYKSGGKSGGGKGGKGGKSGYKRWANINVQTFDTMRSTTAQKPTPAATAASAQRAASAASSAPAPKTGTVPRAHLRICARANRARTATSARASLARLRTTSARSGRGRSARAFSPARMAAPALTTPVPRAATSARAPPGILETSAKLIVAPGQRCIHADLAQLDTVMRPSTRDAETGTTSATSVADV